MRVTVDEARESTEPVAVELGNLAVEWLQVAHPADGRDAPVLAEQVRIGDDLDFPERRSAKRRSRPAKVTTCDRSRTSSRADSTAGLTSAPRGGIGGRALLGRSLDRVYVAGVEVPEDSAGGIGRQHTLEAISSVPSATTTIPA